MLKGLMRTRLFTPTLTASVVKAGPLTPKLILDNLCFMSHFLDTSCGVYWGYFYFFYINT